jgi:hypothetical protein
MNNLFGIKKPSSSDTNKDNNGISQLNALNSNSDRIDLVGSQMDIENKFSSKIMKEEFKKPFGQDLNFMDRLYIDAPSLKSII